MKDKGYIDGHLISRLGFPSLIQNISLTHVNLVHEILEKRKFNCNLIRSQNSKSLFDAKNKMKTYSRCRICGFNAGYFPWGADGKSPDFTYCSCCGCEFGYQDSSLAGIRNWRKEWERSGYAWKEPDQRPENWDLEQQLASIANEFL
ncbi:hypothetical protein [Leptospira noguchii]|uniref:hypothetical protein n=1 Tax=Leptospira noguchii TaxID=28182 RepID=UPI001F3F92E7|nr:hypothetical protein [Leptospira noguchii]